jgi:exonuclease SbcC
MKILNLRFENINSLAGKWEIDFTDPSFNGGIFILCGATGAGKTSILDALCLALYGRTSRQNSFNKEQNEVMTKGTSSCFAQVEFEANNRRYRSFWEHKKQKTGGFQNTCKRRFYQIDGSENLLGETITEVNNQVITVLGMDFHQFTSAVLLPQGKFDAFLNADKKQRAEILEKISRTQVYSKIGAAVHSRMSTEESELKILGAKIGEIDVFSGQQEEELAQNITELTSRLEAERKKLEDSEKLLKQLEEKESL